MALASSSSAEGGAPSPVKVPAHIFEELFGFPKRYEPSPGDSSQNSSACASSAYRLDTFQPQPRLGSEDITTDEAESGESPSAIPERLDVGGPPSTTQAQAATAERRAAHNAVERARRECLNARFLELARALPTMANVKRPSKSAIVNKSLEWICSARVREHQLLKENALLRAQVNQLQAQLLLGGVDTNSSMQARSAAAPMSNSFPDQTTALPRATESFEMSGIGPISSRGEGHRFF